jgi:hypothetical protein
MTDQRIFVFSRRRAAVEAYRVLRAAGFRASDLSLLVHASPPQDRETRTAADRAADAAGVAGAEIGGAAGGVVGALAGLGLLPIPGVGPLLAVGPLAAALTGAITGGALGGLAGSLAGFGVTEAEARASEAHLKAGRSVLIVACGARCKEAEGLAREAGALVADLR